MRVESIQLRCQRLQDGLRSLRQIVRCSRISGQIIKLWLRCPNVQILSRAPRFERAPSESLLWKVAASIRGLIRLGICFGSTEQRLTLHLRGNRDARSLEHSRRNVEQTYPGFHSFAGHLVLRQLHQQWHTDGFVIQEDSVCVFAVCAQAFAMIGRHDNDRLVIKLHRPQRGDELPDRGIGQADPTVVRQFIGVNHV